MTAAQTIREEIKNVTLHTKCLLDCQTRFEKLSPVTFLMLVLGDLLDDL